jgi:hypothetical protein
MRPQPLFIGGREVAAKQKATINIKQVLIKKKKQKKKKLKL